MATTQKRRYPRVKAQNVAAHILAGRRAPACVIENISEGGIFLRTDELLPVGTAVQVTLVRPGMKKALALGGRVVAHHATGDAAHALPGMGICFDGADGESSERLRGLMGELGVARPVEFGWAAPVQRPVEMELDAHVLQDAGRNQSAPVESARLMLQLQGLLRELDDARAELQLRDRRIRELEKEVETARTAHSIEDQLVLHVHDENKDLRNRLQAAEKKLEQVRALVAR